MSETKNHQLQVKITEKDYVIVKQLRKEGINISELVRTLIKDHYLEMEDEIIEENYP